MVILNHKMPDSDTMLIRETDFLDSWGYRTHITNYSSY